MVLVAGDQPQIVPKSMYKVTFDHFERQIQFVTLSALQKTIETFRYAEGGDPIGEEFASGITFPDVTGERGFDGDEQLQNWADAVADAILGGGQAPDRYKHNGEVVLLNWDRTEAGRFELERVFPKDFQAFTGVDTGDKTSPTVQSCSFGLKRWRRSSVA